MTTDTIDSVSTDMHRHCPARSRPLLAFAAGSVVLLLALTGCSNEQRRDLGEIDVRDALHGEVERAVADNDLDVDGDLDCTSDIAADSKVVASCAGTLTSGEAINGTFAGMADVEAEQCSALLVITVGGAEIVNDPDAECFAAI